MSAVNSTLIYTLISPIFEGTGGYHMKTIKILGLLTFAIAATLYGCRKTNDPESFNLRVKLTDAPGPYDSVVVYIDSVVVNNDSAGGWETLNTNSGYYDLLQLNGSDTTLVNNTNLNDGYLHQMRLILADDKCYVVDTNGVKSFLELSSQDKTGLKLNLNTSVDPGSDYELLIDFDAEKSIIQQGNGKIRLKPVLKKVYLNKL